MRDNPMTAVQEQHSAQPPALTRKHLAQNNFDFLRLLFAVLVILAHAWGTGRFSEYEPLYLFSSKQDHFGSLAVNGFFAISGFLITASALRSRSILDYLLKRILRIYPAFILATFVGILIVYPLSVGIVPHFWHPKMALHLLLSCTFLRTVENYAPFEHVAMPTSFPNNTIHLVNGSMWTIPYEFGCYFLVAILAFIILRRNRTVGSIIVAILFAASYATYLYGLYHASPAWPGGHRMRPYLEYFFLSLSHWPRFLTYFLAGALVFYFQSRILFHYVLALVAFTLLVAVAAMPDLWPGHGYFHHAAPFLFTYLVFALAFEKRLPLQHFARFGDFSYGTYLYAFPIQQLLQQYKPDLDPLIHFAIAAPAAILCGAISWHACEKWFLRLKPKRVAPGIKPVPAHSSGEPHQLA